MVDNEGAGAGAGDLQRPLLPDAGSDGQQQLHQPHQPHQQASRGTAPPWELVASSSSELDEAEEAFADGQAATGGGGEGGGPFLSSSAALPLHNQPVLLPWAQGVTTPSGRLLREESSRLSVSGSGGPTARRGWGRRLAKLLFWPPPILRWLPRYTRQQALGDALGALCVAVMVVPQGMSYAVLAGLPPVYGLFAAMSGPLVYTALGTSRHLSIGPVALVSLSLPSVCEVLYPSIADLPDDEAAALRVQAATAVALVSGVLLAVLGLLRLGAVAHVIPSAVMVGFTSAAALAIGVSQLKELLGLKVPRYPYTWQTCSYVLSHLGDGQWASAVRTADRLDLNRWRCRGVMGRAKQSAQASDGAPNLSHSFNPTPQIIPKKGGGLWRHPLFAGDQARQDRLGRPLPERAPQAGLPLPQPAQQPPPDRVDGPHRQPPRPQRRGDRHRQGRAGEFPLQRKRKGKGGRG